jgi:bifunctional non-homologous end joining protein LigD
MALGEYKRKRDFKKTPEPSGKLEKTPGNRFVVQKHHATRLHFDFRLEMDGVLKSWAVPKGPPLDPADKRLAMQVEDHPVSYFDFEGIIPPGNYGAGTVMVWDTGKWEPLGNPNEMLAKGDLKFRLSGEKLNGEFVLAHMKSRRPGSKGTEWLLIKKRDEFVKPGFEANDSKYDASVLTGRSLDEIAADQGSAEWESNRPAAAKAKNSWLAGALAQKKTKSTEKDVEVAKTKSKSKTASASAKIKKTSAPSASFAVSDLKSVKGAVKQPMPRSIHPQLATLIDAPFDDNDWLFEVKFDGYRALAFINDGDMRLISRNQNELTAEFPEIGELPSRVGAKQAILDGEICALDQEGRPSFSLMQQRTGFEPGKGPRRSKSPTIAGQMTIVYYVFDLLYLEGYSLLRVDLEKRKELLKSILDTNETIHYSDHFIGNGTALLEAAKQKGLEGIVAKRRKGCYEQKRSREWLKIKITQTQDCVIGGYTEPRGSREYFGSLVLGLYDDKDRLTPVGQAGSGFTQKSQAEVWKLLKKIEANKSPFYTKPDSSRGLHYLRPELVAEIRFTEWTHAGQKGGLKMRAPVFVGIRFDKKPEECRFELKKSAKEEIAKAEKGKAA